MKTKKIGEAAKRKRRHLGWLAKKSLKENEN